MRRIVDLLRVERRARIFFALLAQSAFGTGAAYVALLLVAYDRLDSAWAISLVLIADLLPPMVLGPIMGAAADRWSRRTCMVVADGVRAVAFVGIALVDGFAATLALAFLAGLGTALFTPASLAALPSLVEERRLPAATSLYGAVADMGLAVGPGLTAAFLLIASSESILAANAATFALSALILARLRFGEAPGSARAAAAAPRTLLSDAGEGIRSIRYVRGLWPVLAASAAAVFFGGLVNVAELPFITEELEAGDAVFSAVVALVGVGIAAGSLAGSAGGEIRRLTTRFTAGLLLSGAGFLAAGLVSNLVVVVTMFTVAGFGNGLTLVHERLFIQRTVPDELMARVFGVRDATTAWGFGTAFVAAGALVSAAGPAAVVVLAGSGLGVVGLAAALFVRQHRRARENAVAAAPVATELPREMIRDSRA